MSKWAALAGSNTALVVFSAAIAVSAIGAGLYINNRSAAEPDAIVQISAPTPEPEAVPEPQESPKTAVTVDSSEMPPSIDEVRVEADGLTIVAGRALPGSKVSVLLDGVENTIVTTDAGGGFAAITMIEPKKIAQVLTVVQRLGDTTVSSLDEIILAPSSGVQMFAEVLSDTDSGQSLNESDTTGTPQGPPMVADVTPDLEIGPEPTTAEIDLAAGESDEVRTDRMPAESVQEAETDNANVALANAGAQLDDGVRETPNARDNAAQSAQVVEPALDPADGSNVAKVVETPKDILPDTTGQSAQVASVSAEPTVAPETRQQLTVLKSTPEGVEALAPRLGATDNIAIDTISYSDAGDVQLSGRAKADAQIVRVYVNNRPVANLEVYEDGRWRGDLPDIDTGVYTLRVDEIDAAGSVMSRVETPFKREDPKLLIGGDTASATAKRITVQTGATLWAIARERYGEGLLYVQVYEANRETIADPDLIYPGQVFALPD